MSVTQVALLSLFLQINQTQDNEAQGGTVRHTFDELKNIRFDNGFGTGQADIGFSDEITLGASSNSDYDLVGGFNNAFGTAQSPAKLKALLVYNDSTTQSLTLKPAAANGISGLFGAAAHSVTIKPGGCFFWYDPVGIALTGGTGDLINVANGAGASAVFRLFAIGTSV